MNILTTCITVLLLVASPISAADELQDVLDAAPKVVLDARSLETDFLALESILEARLKASKMPANLNNLMETTKELISQRDPTSSGEKHQNRRLKKAAKKFVRLEKALDRCDFQGYYTLASNFKGALNCPLFLAAIREAITRHSDICRKTYLGQFKQKRVGAQLMQKLDKVIDERVLEQVFRAQDSNETTSVPSKFDPHNMEAVLKNNLWAPIRKIDNLLLENIVELTNGTKRAKYFKKTPLKAAAEDGAQLRAREFERQLIKPCKRLVKEYADIFYAAKLDLAAESIDNKTKFSEINPKNDQRFTDTWIKFRVCQAIKEDSEGVLKRLLAEAEKKLLSK